jgi:hypothetical protein
MILFFFIKSVHILETEVCLLSIKWKVIVILAKRFYQYKPKNVLDSAAKREVNFVGL